MAQCTPDTWRIGGSFLLLLLYHFIHTLYIYITKVYRYSVLVNIYSISKKFTHTYSSPSRFQRVNK